MLGTVYKSRRQVKGFAEMSIFLNKSYLLKVSTKGGGGQNTPNSVNVVCTSPAPCNVALIDGSFITLILSQKNHDQKHFLY